MEGDKPVYTPNYVPGWPAMEVNEEREFYVPELLSDPTYEPRPEAYAAAEAHGRRLRRAERLVEEAALLAEVLRLAMGDAGDARAMQVDTVVGIVERKLRKARAAIDGQDTRDLNLFLAYAELKAQTGSGRPATP